MITNTDRDFYTMMREIPLIEKDNLLEFSKLPENAPTRQIVWAELLARLKIVSFLVEISPSNLKKQSRMQLNTLKKIFDQMESSDGLSIIGDKQLITDVETEILRIRLATK